MWNRVDIQSVEVSVRLYGLLLFAYPRAFRRAFGPAMRDDFRALLTEAAAGGHGPATVWGRVFLELAPTLLREHTDVLGGRLASLWRRPQRGAFLRESCAAGLVLAGYAWCLRQTTDGDSGLLLTAWFISAAAGVVSSRGRGKACLRRAVLGGWAGAALAFAWLALEQPPLGGVLPLALLLLGSAAAASLVFASGVRLLLEGLRFGPAAGPATH